MEVLVRWTCDCGTLRWACPRCHGKGMVVRWIPPEVLPLLQRPYTILSQRLAPSAERAAS